MSPSVPVPQSPNTAADIIREAAHKWPSTFIARAKVPEFTGGLVAVGTIANADCAGTGPEGAFKFGRQMAYPINSLCDWLIKRVDGKA